MHFYPINSNQAQDKALNLCYVTTLNAITVKIKDQGFSKCSSQAISGPQKHYAQHPKNVMFAARPPVSVGLGMTNLQKATWCMATRGTSRLSQAVLFCHQCYSFVFQWTTQQFNEEVKRKRDHSKNTVWLRRKEGFRKNGSSFTS